MIDQRLSGADFPPFSLPSERLQVCLRQSGPWFSDFGLTAENTKNTKRSREGPRMPMGTDFYGQGRVGSQVSARALLRMIVRAGDGRIWASKIVELFRCGQGATIRGVGAAFVLTRRVDGFSRGALLSDDERGLPLLPHPRSGCSLGILFCRCCDSATNRAKSH